MLACSWLNGSLRIHIPVWRILLFTYYYICPYRYLHVLLLLLFYVFLTPAATALVHGPLIPLSIGPQEYRGKHTHTFPLCPTIRPSSVYAWTMYAPHIIITHCLSASLGCCRPGGGHPRKIIQCTKMVDAHCVERRVCVRNTNTYAYICIIYTFIYRAVYLLHAYNIYIYMYNVAINSVPVFNIDARLSQG